MSERPFCRVSLLIAVAAIPAIAQNVAVVLDTGKSSVQFTLGDVLHTVRGTFKLKGGEFRFDPATGKAGGQIVVDVRSGDTGSGARDRRMHKDILESDKYPDAVFLPDKIIGGVGTAGTAQVQIHGTLRLHGADHEVTLPAKVQWQGDRVSASAAFTVPYVQWGMKNPSTFILRVNQTVDLQMNVAGRIRPKSE